MKTHINTTSNTTNNTTINTPSGAKRTLAALAGAITLVAGTQLAEASPPSATPVTTDLAAGIAGASGSTIGPDGALYVTESDTGQVLRVDVDDGSTSVYASGLPTRIAPIGGPMDVVFHDETAYVLVSLVGDFFGSTDANGIYRMDGPGEWTVIADLGQWALDNPPGDELEYFIPTGVHYAIEVFQGRFIVTDGHHNTLLSVDRSGGISEVRRYGNIVPTGLDTWGKQILMGVAGPKPHLPEDGRVLSVTRSGDTEVAVGAPLLVDVERGGGATLFGLAQGDFPDGAPDGSPAIPGTGVLMRVEPDGTMTSVATGLDRPTSMEIIGNTAYVVGLAGTVVQIDGIAGPPFGRR